MKPIQYLRDTIKMVSHIESSFIELGMRLLKISDEKLYLGEYDTFNDFLLEANIKPAVASKLISVNKTFLVEGKVSPEKMASIGYSKLYEAIPFVETEGVTMALAKAQTLSRNEIVEEKRQIKSGEHVHMADGPDRWGVCTCGKFVKIDG